MADELPVDKTVEGWESQKRLKKRGLVSWEPKNFFEGEQYRKLVQCSDYSVRGLAVVLTVPDNGSK